MRILAYFVVFQCNIHYGLSNVFVPFGSAEGDSQTPIQDDGFAKIDVLPPFKYYGNLYSSIYVNNDGIISFNKEVEISSVQGRFPLSGTNKVVICVFCSDIDITKGGEVWYGLRTDSATLKAISDHIKSHFSNDFNPVWVVVGTWSNVKSFANDATEGSGNTFQVILTTDSVLSYVIFDYGEMIWVFDSTNAYPEDPIVIRAKCGFNAGDGVQSYLHPDSNTEELKNIDTDSNINIPGQFLYQVDIDIVSPGSSVSTSATGASPSKTGATSSGIIGLSGVTNQGVTTTSKPTNAVLTSSTTTGIKYETTNVSSTISTGAVTSYTSSIGVTVLHHSTSEALTDAAQSLSTTNEYILTSSQLTTPSDFTTSPTSSSSQQFTEYDRSTQLLTVHYALIGTAVGFALILAAIGIYCYFIYKAKRQKRIQQEADLKNSQLSPASDHDRAEVGSPFKIPRPKISNNRIHAV